MISSPPPTDRQTPPPPGLRERKKAQTRAAIQRHALRLFHEQGYAATTMEQIAEAADVSPSTLYRYFPTKEDLVLSDDYDPVLAAALRAEPAEFPPLEALRRVITSVMRSLPPEDLADLTERAQFTLSIPEVRAKAMDNFVVTMEMLAELFAERLGRTSDDFTSRVLAGTAIGAILAAQIHWAAHPEEDLWGLIDQGLAQVSDPTRRERD